MPEPIYVIDTNSFIYAWRDFYTPASFGFVWERIDDLIQGGRIISHAEVMEEIDHPEDLREWLEDEERARIFLESTAQERATVGDLQTKYPPFKPKGGRANWADPWIVAKAKHTEGAIVVTEEKEGALSRIPKVCEEEEITWMRVSGMVNEIVR